MTISTLPQSLKNQLNNASPAQLADMLRAIGYGDIVRRMSATLRRQAAPANTANVLSSYDLAINGVIVLPDDAKAKAISRAYARAGSAAPGELTIDAPARGTFPTITTLHAAVTPAGNIATLGSDAWTDLDIVYEMADQDVVELTLPVVPGTGILTIPAAYAGVAGSGVNTTLVKDTVNNVAGAKGVNMLMEVEVLAGGATGKCIVLVPGGTNPASGYANLDVTKSMVYFHAADAVTQARVKLGVFRTIDLNALLEAVGNYV